MSSCCLGFNFQPTWNWNWKREWVQKISRRRNLLWSPFLHGVRSVVVRCRFFPSPHSFGGRLSLFGSPPFLLRCDWFRLYVWCRSGGILQRKQPNVLNEVSKNCQTIILVYEFYIYIVHYTSILLFTHYCLKRLKYAFSCGLIWLSVAMLNLSTWILFFTVLDGSMTKQTILVCTWVVVGWKVFSVFVSHFTVCLILEVLHLVKSYIYHFSFFQATRSL